MTDATCFHEPAQFGCPSCNQRLSGQLATSMREEIDRLRVEEARLQGEVLAYKDIVDEQGAAEDYRTDKLARYQAALDLSDESRDYICTIIRAQPQGTELLDLAQAILVGLRRRAGLA